MPRDTSDIGTHGLEQGGANLGNEINRPITSERNEQNTTTNPGSGKVARDENEPDLSERILDKEDDEEGETSLEQKAQIATEKVKSAGQQDKQRSDNQLPSERILDKEEDGDEGGSAPDRDMLKMRGD